MKERHDIDEIDLETSYKNFFTNNFIVDIFVFWIAIISVITTMIIIYTLCKCNKLKTLVASLALLQVKEVSASTTKKEDENYMCDCMSQFYIVLVLSITTTGLVIFMILQVRRIKLCRGRLYIFLNVVKIMLFISDVQYYVLVKLFKTPGSIHLFMIMGKLTSDKVKLNKHYIWDILEIDWKEIKVTFIGKIINLPNLIMIKLWDKFN